MNRADLTSEVASLTNLTKTDVDRLMLSLFKNITETLQRGEDVTLSGFGTFSTRERAGRNGVNPYTGDAIKIPSKKVVKFKPGKKLDEIVKKS